MAQVKQEVNTLWVKNQNCAKLAKNLAILKAVIAFKLDRAGSVLVSNPGLWVPPQKTIFSTGTPVAAATVAPILATNTIPSATTAGKLATLLLLPGKNEA